MLNILNSAFTRDKQEEIVNLRNLGGFPTTRFANYYGGGVGLHQIENGGSVLVNRKSLPLLLDARIPKSAGTQYKASENLNIYI